MTPDEELADEILHHSLSLFRLAASQVAATTARLKAMEKKLIAELSVPLLSERRKSEIKQILENADEIIAEYYGNIPDELSPVELGETVAKVTGNSLEVALGVEAANLPTQAYLKSLASNVLLEGGPLKDWWQAQADDTSFKFANQVRQGLANAETNQKIIGRIVGTRTSPGIMDVARRNAASLVQTSVQAVANDARLTTFRANADILLGIEQISTLDSHTTLICMAYSGAQWDLEGKPLNGSPPFLGGPPRHFNCRSVLVGISKNAILRNRKSTRASDEGQISNKTTFDEFLKRKSKAYVDEMLGVGRADLWRAGKITLRDLVSGTGRPLTLTELQVKFD